jgi:hypothetical protein
VRGKGARGKNDIVVNKFFKYKIVGNGFSQSAQNTPPVRYPKGEPVPENRGEWVERSIGLCPILVVYLERMDVSPWESWKLL